MSTLYCVTILAHTLVVFACSNLTECVCGAGGPRELPLTGDLWDREQEQPRNKGFSADVAASTF